MKRKNYIKYVILFIIIIGSVIGAVLLSSIISKGKVVSNITLTETDNTTYNVTYVKNDFYDDDIIENNSYVREFVDNININYNYVINLSEKVSGNYTYSVVGQILVYEPGNEANDYWKNTTTIVDKSTVEFDDTKTISVNALANVDYQKFYEMYRDFKSSNIVTNEAKLFVKLILNYNGDYQNFNKFNNNREVTVAIPLSEVAFKITQSNNLINPSQVLTKKTSIKNESLYRIISISLWVFALLFSIIFIIIYNKDRREMTPYYRKLKKILTTYDSIIVNVDKLASLDDVSIAKVTTFEELLDAQQEVRLPINFKEDKKKKMAKFILLRNNFAWVYVLKDGEDDEI